MHLISFNFIVRAIDRDEFRITFSRDKDILTIQGKSFPQSMEWNERVSVIGKPGYARMYDNVTIDGIKR